MTSTVKCSQWQRLLHWARWGRQQPDRREVNWNASQLSDAWIGDLDSLLHAVAQQGGPPAAGNAAAAVSTVPDGGRGTSKNASLTRHQLLRLSRLAEVEGTTLDALVQLIVEEALSRRTLLLSMVDDEDVDHHVRPATTVPAGPTAAVFYLEKLRAG